MGIFPTWQHLLNCRKRLLLLYIVYDIDFALCLVSSISCSSSISTQQASLLVDQTLKFEGCNWVNNYIGHGVVLFFNLNSCAPYELYLCLSIFVSLFLCICLSLSPYLNTSMDLSSFLILTSEFLLNWETINMVLCRCGNNINFHFLIASVAEF